MKWRSFFIGGKMAEPVIRLGVVLKNPSNVGQVKQFIDKSLNNAPVNVKINVSGAGGAKATLSNVNNLNKSMSGLNKTATASSAAFAKAFRDVDNFGRSIARSDSGIANMTKQFKTLNKETNTAASRLKEFSNQISVAATRYAAFVASSSIIVGVIASIGDGINQAIKYQKELIRFQQVGSDTASTIKGLSQEIRSLSKDFGASSLELARTAVTLRQAGFAATDTKIALDALAKSTLAPNFDKLEDTVEGLIATNSQFNISIRDSEKALSQINAVAGAYAAEASDLITGIRKLGGAFSSAGGSFEELLGIITAIRSTTRESADTIATGLRTILARTQRSATIEELERLGINLRANAVEAKQFGIEVGAILPVFARFQKISAAAANIPKSDPRFAQILELVGGIRQLSKTTPIILNFNKAAEATNLALRSTNTLAKDATIGQKALATQLDEVRESFLELFETLGSNKFLRKMISEFLELTKSLNELTKSAEPLVPILAALALKGTASVGSNVLNRLVKGNIPISARTQTGFGGSGVFIKRNRGGSIPRARGGIIPGPNVNADIINDTLEPGSFVLRRDVTKKVFGFNKGGQVPVKLTPGEIKLPPEAVSKFGLGTLNLLNTTNGKALTPQLRERLMRYLNQLPNEKNKETKFALKRNFIAAGGNPSLVQGLNRGGMARRRKLNLGDGPGLPDDLLPFVLAQYNDAVLERTDSSGRTIRNPDKQSFLKGLADLEREYPGTKRQLQEITARQIGVGKDRKPNPERDTKRAVNIRKQAAALNITPLSQRGIRSLQDSVEDATATRDFLPNASREDAVRRAAIAQQNDARIRVALNKLLTEKNPNRFFETVSSVSGLKQSDILKRLTEGRNQLPESEANRFLSGSFDTLVAAEPGSKRRRKQAGREPKRPVGSLTALFQGNRSINADQRLNLLREFVNVPEDFVAPKGAPLFSQKSTNLVEDQLKALEQAAAGKNITQNQLLTTLISQGAIFDAKGEVIQANKSNTQNFSKFNRGRGRSAFIDPTLASQALSGLGVSFDESKFPGFGQTASKPDKDIEDILIRSARRQGFLRERDPQTGSLIQAGGPQQYRLSSSIVPGEANASTLFNNIPGQPVPGSLNAMPIFRYNQGGNTPLIPGGLGRNFPTDLNKNLKSVGDAVNEANIITKRIGPSLVGAELPILNSALAFGAAQQRIRPNPVSLSGSYGLRAGRPALSPNTQLFDAFASSRNRPGPVRLGRGNPQFLPLFPDTIPLRPSQRGGGGIVPPRGSFIAGGFDELPNGPRYTGPIPSINSAFQSPRNPFIISSVPSNVRSRTTIDPDAINRANKALNVLPNQFNIPQNVGDLFKTGYFQQAGIRNIEDLSKISEDLGFGRVATQLLPSGKQFGTGAVGNNRKLDDPAIQSIVDRLIPAVIGRALSGTSQTSTNGIFGNFVASTSNAVPSSFIQQNSTTAVQRNLKQSNFLSNVRGNARNRFNNAISTFPRGRGIGAIIGLDEFGGTPGSLDPIFNDIKDRRGKVVGKGDRIIGVGGGKRFSPGFDIDISGVGKSGLRRDGSRSRFVSDLADPNISINKAGSGKLLIDELLATFGNDKSLVDQLRKARGFLARDADGNRQLGKASKIISEIAKKDKRILDTIVSRKNQFIDRFVGSQEAFINDTLRLASVDAGIDPKQLRAIDFARPGDLINTAIPGKNNPSSVVGKDLGPRLGLRTQDFNQSFLRERVRKELTRSQSPLARLGLGLGLNDNLRRQIEAQSTVATSALISQDLGRSNTLARNGSFTDVLSGEFRNGLRGSSTITRDLITSLSDQSGQAITGLARGGDQALSRFGSILGNRRLGSLSEEDQVRLLERRARRQGLGVGNAGDLQSLVGGAQQLRTSSGAGLPSIFGRAKGAFGAISRNQTVQRVGGSLANPAGAIALGLLAGQVAPKTISRENTRSAGFSGALQGAGTGALVGSVGGAPGAILGAFTGAISGAILSVRDFDKQIKELDFERDFTKFSRDLSNIAARGNSLTGSDISSVGSFISSVESEATRRFTDPKLQKDFVNTTFGASVQQLQDVIGIIARTPGTFSGENTPDQNLKKFFDFAGGQGTSIARAFASGSGITQNDANKAIKEQIKQAIAAEQSSKALGNLARESDRIANLFDNLANAVNIATIKYQEGNDNLNAFSLSLGTSQVNNSSLSRGFEAFGVLGGEDIFNRSAQAISSLASPRITSVAGGIPITGQGALFNQLTQANQASALLPDIIRTISQDPLGEGLSGNRVSELLGERGIGTNLTKLIADAVDALGEGFQEQAENPQELARNLINTALPNIDKLAQVAKQLELSTQAFIDALDKGREIELQRREFTNQGNQLRDNLRRQSIQFGGLPLVRNPQAVRAPLAAQLGLVPQNISQFAGGAVFEPSRLERQIARNPLLRQQGLRPSPTTRIGGDPALALSIEQLNQPFIQSQRSLTGNINGLDPRAIGTELDRVLGEITKGQELVRTNPNDTGAITNLKTLENSAKDLDTALRNLTDITQVNAAAQEKLAAIEQERSGAISFAERFIQANPLERQQIVGNLNQAAVATRVGLDNFNQPQQANILNTLRTIVGDSQTGFGASGNQIADQLIQRSMVGNFANNLRGAQTFGQIENARQNTQGAILEGAQRAIQATEILARNTEGERRTFFSQLQTNQSSFLNNLANVITLAEQEALKQQISNIQVGSRSNISAARLGADLFEGGLNPNDVSKVLSDKNSRLFATAREQQQNFDRVSSSRSGLISSVESINFSNLKKGNFSLTDDNSKELRNLITESGLTTTPEQALTNINNRLKQVSSVVIPPSGPGGSPTFVNRALSSDEIRSIAVSEIGKLTRSDLNQASTERGNAINELTQQSGIPVETIVRLIQSNDKQFEGFTKLSEAINSTGGTFEGLIESNAAQFGRIDELNKSLDLLRQSIDQNKGVPPAQGLALGGTVKTQYYGTGDLVSQAFKPRGTDTVPAMLTEGEFVVNRASTKKYRPILETINNPAYLAKGGFVSPYGIKNPNDIDNLFKDSSIKNVGEIRSLIEEAKEMFAAFEERRKRGRNFTGGGIEENQLNGRFTQVPQEDVNNLRLTLDRISRDTSNLSPQDNIRKPINEVFAELRNADKNAGLYTAPSGELANRSLSDRIEATSRKLVSRSGVIAKDSFVAGSEGYFSGLPSLQAPMGIAVRNDLESRKIALEQIRKAGLSDADKQRFNVNNAPALGLQLDLGDKITRESEQRRREFLNDPEIARKNQEFSETMFLQNSRNRINRAEINRFEKVRQDINSKIPVPAKLNSLEENRRISQKIAADNNFNTLLTESTPDFSRGVATRDLSKFNLDPSLVAPGSRQPSGPTPSEVLANIRRDSDLSINRSPDGSQLNSAQQTTLRRRQQQRDRISSNSIQASGFAPPPTGFSSLPVNNQGNQPENPLQAINSLGEALREFTQNNPLADLAAAADAMRIHSEQLRQFSEVMRDAKITVESQHRVEVIHNGMELFNLMRESIKEELFKETVAAIQSDLEKQRVDGV